MKPEHDFPCEHCGPQVLELAILNTRYRNALEEIGKVSGDPYVLDLVESGLAALATTVAEKEDDRG